MDSTANTLSAFENKVSQLEGLIYQSLTNKQLFEIAHEAAKNYQVLVKCLKDKERLDREQLCKLSHKFSRIEIVAIRKINRDDRVAQTESII